MDALGKVAEQLALTWANLIAQVLLFAIVTGSEAFRQAGVACWRNGAAGLIVAQRRKYQETTRRGRQSTRNLAKANAESQRLLEEVRARRTDWTEQRQVPGAGLRRTDMAR